MTAMQLAGALAIFIAVGHGWMGDKTLREQGLADTDQRNFIRAAYQFGTAGWIAVGSLLLTSTGLEAADRQILGVASIALFGFGAVVNAWFTKGRHPGWVLLAALCGLVAVGW